MNAHPRVAIVAPAHNGIERTVRFLDSTRLLTYPTVDVVVVDDGSTDGTAATIAHRFPDVTVLHGDGSLWWSGATNLGVEWAQSHGADYVFIVNTDTELDPDVLTHSVETAQANRRALVGSMIVTQADRDDVWFFGAKFDVAQSEVRNVSGRKGDFAEVTDVDILTGMGMLIPIAAFSEVGRFDERRLPQYFADSDFALRARAHGYASLLDPRAVVVCDTESSWSAAQRRGRPSLAYPFVLLFSKRSPESVRHLGRFYIRHWPSRPRRALARHYGALIKNELLAGFLPRYVRSLRRGGGT